MTIGSSNVRFYSIQSEFGGTNPIRLSEYYKGGAYVPLSPPLGSYTPVTINDGPGNIPTSGAIKLSNFKNSSYRTVILVVISSSISNFNLTTTIYNACGYAPSIDSWGPVDCTCVINSGCTVYSTSTSTPAFDTNNYGISSGWPSSSTLTIFNNGTIVGKGGDGGNTNVVGVGGAGGFGGPAINTVFDGGTYIYNYGSIWGGAGGGGAGGSATWKNVWYAENEYIRGGGGGGGWDYIGSSGGVVGTPYGSTAGNMQFYGWYTYYAPTNGTGGTNVSYGNGGIGAHIHFYRSDYDPPFPPEGYDIYSGDGGIGNDPGYDGLNGSAANGTNWYPDFQTTDYYIYNGGSGGTRGYYLYSNFCPVTWNVLGDVQGRVG